MKDYTVSELKIAKSETENSISKLIDLFQQEYNVSVSDLNFRNIYMQGGERPTKLIELILSIH